MRNICRNGGKSEFFLKTLLVVISTLIPLIIFEIFVWFVLDYRSPHHPPRVFQIDSITGWSKKPDFEGYWYLYSDGTRSHVRNNSHGFTDRERTFEKSKPRIALIGDSTTEFWEAEEKDRGQALMERSLDDRWEVLNMGVRGFSTDQAYLLLKHKGIAFSPDIVIYTFCINDLHGNAKMNKPRFELAPGEPGNLVLRDFPYPFKEIRNKKPPATIGKRWEKAFYQYSFLFRKTSHLLTRHPMGLFYTEMPLQGQTELRPYKKIYSAEEQSWQDMFVALVLDMKRFLDSRGVKFLLVEGVYGNVLDPQRMAWSVDQYGDVFDPLKVTHLLDDFARQSEIPFLSLQDEVRRRGIAIGDIMHSEDYVHLNAAGIRFYSERVLEKLKSLGWV